MADSNAPVIIKKVKKGHHDGHHGGAWKVAYADFVTAMMAFFLLLWLLNVTTDEQKRGIADYFAPVIGVYSSNTGGEGMFQGKSIASEDNMQDQAQPPVFSMSLPTPDMTTRETESEPSDTTTENQREELQPETLEEAMARREEEQFAEAEHLLRQAIQDIPDLAQLAENLIIDRTPEGLRIQLVDQEGLSMFPRGSALPYPHTRKLLSQVAEIINRLPQKISITGHTDALPYLSNRGYSNWELSVDRANASRRALIESGVNSSRLAYVTGKAAQDPLLIDDPTSPRNRRIAIVLLRKQAEEATLPPAPSSSPGATLNPG